MYMRYWGCGIGHFVEHAVHAEPEPEEAGTAVPDSDSENSADEESHSDAASRRSQEGVEGSGDSDPESCSNSEFTNDAESASTDAGSKEMTYDL
jgi:hypothetical protein